ncbi:MAG: UDP-N-acetylmuramate--L-alanine ligase [Bdellovibrionaceae bacterium]|nr:UDP-N-acetylmuramate--L-alanine ligase [Pseudobdellovibrionaceae bacterium]
MKLKTARFHFVGIGGIGMCGLAELLHNMGATVTGSDLSENANTERLKSLGVSVFRGHEEKNVGDATVLVYSSAVPKNNPEVIEAMRRRIPVIPRAEALAEIMRLKRGIAVAGTHGKTTTTSMVASIFLHAKLNPTIVVGGRFDQIKSTALLGEGEWLIAEADESDGSFQKLSPEISIITNIDSDHLDHFKSFENLQKAFVEFAYRIPFFGKVIVWGDDPDVRRLFNSFTKSIEFYGFERGNDLVVTGAEGLYQLQRSSQSLGEFRIQVPGRHNALNATAAIAAGLQAGLTFEVCAAGIAQFSGVDRRFHLKGEKRGIAVYDDYGHHPTEVRAVLSAFREKYPKRRLVVMFQPHRYTRTQNCWQEFTKCFAEADVLLMTDIYPAGETEIPGILASRLLAETQVNKKVYLPRGSDIVSSILAELKEGDVFVTLGAGDGWKVGMEVLAKL